MGLHRGAWWRGDRMAGGGAGPIFGRDRENRFSQQLITNACPACADADLPAKAKIINARRVLNGIFKVLRSEAPRRDLRDSASVRTHHLQTAPHLMFAAFTIGHHLSISALW